MLSTLLYVMACKLPFQRLQHLHELYSLDSGALSMHPAEPASILGATFLCAGVRIKTLQNTCVHVLFSFSRQTSWQVIRISLKSDKFEFII